MTKKELMTIRPAEPGDHAFIFRSWLMGAYHGNRAGKGVRVPVGAPGDYLGSIDQDAFMKGYHKYIESMLTGATVSVACLRENPDVILGFSVSSGPVLHWVFVKPDWRKIGIARDLVPQYIETVTGFSRVGEVLRKKYNYKFNPFV